jgi:hypothetical protein
MSTPIGSHRMSRHAPAMMIGAAASRANVSVNLSAKLTIG